VLSKTNELKGFYLLTGSATPSPSNQAAKPPNQLIVHGLVGSCWAPWLYGDHGEAAGAARAAGEAGIMAPT